MLLFRQISWEQFGIALGILLLCYYLAVVWYGYRPELAAFFTQAETEPKPAMVEEAAPQLVAASKADEGFSQLDSEDLVFAEEPVQEQQLKTLAKNNTVFERIKQDHRKAALIGNVADFMEETRKLLDDAQQAGENKQSVLNIVLLLSPGLQELEGTTYPEALKLFVYDEISKRFDFPLKPEELQPLWQTPKESIQKSSKKLKA